MCREKAMYPESACRGIDEVGTKRNRAPKTEGTGRGYSPRADRKNSVEAMRSGSQEWTKEGRTYEAPAKTAGGHQNGVVKLKKSRKNHH